MAVVGARETTASVVFLSVYQPRTPPRTIQQQCQRPRRVHRAPACTLIAVSVILGKCKCGDRTGRLYEPPCSIYRRPGGLVSCNYTHDKTHTKLRSYIYVVCCKIERASELSSKAALALRAQRSRHPLSFRLSGASPPPPGGAGWWARGEGGMSTSPPPVPAPFYFSACASFSASRFCSEWISACMASSRASCLCANSSSMV